MFKMENRNKHIKLNPPIFPNNYSAYLILTFHSIIIIIIIITNTPPTLHNNNSNMCCSETTPSSTPRVGARVDFFSSSRGHLGNLLFLNPSAPASPLATHVRFSPKNGIPMNDHEGVTVSIQSVRCSASLYSIVNMEF